MPISSFFGGVQRFAGQALGQAQRAYSQLDQASGGWLPGGGIASPVTKAIFPAQKYPGRSKELERITGVKGRFVDPAENPTLVRRTASAISPRWGDADYANPLLNEIGMSNYKGGATPKERRIEFHELGHLNPKDKGLYSYFGVLGRGLQGISEKTGNFPPLGLAAGLALQHTDAPEEDRAERFANRFAKIGKYDMHDLYGMDVNDDGSSDYGNMLRREGKELADQSLNKMTDPYNFLSKATKFVNEQRAKPIQSNLATVDTNMNTYFEQNPNMTFNTSPPEFRELVKKRQGLHAELRNLGIDPYQ
jgi:hypothetical protein